MKNLTQYLKQEYNSLLEELKSGDKINISGCSDRIIKTSEKTMNARMKVINEIRQMLINKEITVVEANQATNKFGRMTTKLFWNKN